MIELNAREIAEATRGVIRGVAEPEAVTLTSADSDSRNITAGALFIAKPGDVTDGHHFIDAALASGADLVLAERETQDPSGLPHPAVIVENVVAAMADLAAEIVRRIREHSPTTVIGITGSSGKTTTKDLLRNILSADGPTVAPQGSYNSEVGVPLTIFTASLDSRFLVIEMGADAPGNITYLSNIVKPDIGVVLMVGSAHAGKFGGTDKIAAVKGELVAAVAPQGQVVRNRDDAQVRMMESRAQAPITWFGLDPRAHILAENVELDALGRPAFDLVFSEEGGHEVSRYPIQSGLTGEHHVSNLLAAAAAARCAGISDSAIAQRLNGQGPSSRWRMEIVERPDGVTIINDAYNANPESMREALKTLARVSRPVAGQPRRSIAVLGAMRELGAEHTKSHIQLGETVVRLNINLLLVVGDEAYQLYRGAVAEGSWNEEAHWVPTLEAAEEFLEREVSPTDVVLFKSSNGVGLRLLGDKIATAAGAVRASDETGHGKVGS